MATTKPASPEPEQKKQKTEDEKAPAPDDKLAWLVLDTSEDEPAQCLDANIAERRAHIRTWVLIGSSVRHLPTAPLEPAFQRKGMVLYTGSYKDMAVNEAASILVRADLQRRYTRGGVGLGSCVLEFASSDAAFLLEVFEEHKAHGWARHVMTALQDYMRRLERSPYDGDTCALCGSHRPMSCLECEETLGYCDEHALCGHHYKYCRLCDAEVCRACIRKVVVGGSQKQYICGYCANCVGGTAADPPNVQYVGCKQCDKGTFCSACGAYVCSSCEDWVEFCEQHKASKGSKGHAYCEDCVDGHMQPDHSDDTAPFCKKCIDEAEEKEVERKAE